MTDSDKIAKTVVVAKTLSVVQYSYNILEHITIAIVIFAI